MEDAWSLILFFAAIGFGFLTIECSQMQRLIMLLGHPTYSLSVVLFGLLLSSGAGSFLTRTIDVQDLGRAAMIRFLLLILVLGLLGLFTQKICAVFQASSTPIRVLVAVMLVFPAGLFMGMAFPLGMKMASSRSEALRSWLWGINGATSVCASVAAIVIALSFGIAAAFWCGVGAYVIAWAAFTRAGRSNATPAS